MSRMDNKRKTIAGKKARGSSSARRTILVVLCIVLAAILVGLVAGVVYMERLMGLMNRVEDTTAATLSSSEILEIENPTEETIPPDFTGPVLSGDDIEWGTPAENTISGDEVVNILLIGQDRREGESRARSDAMILCTFYKEAKTLTMTSFMRDMYVQIPGYQDNRINTAYSLGGIELLNETIALNFGVEIDGNVEVDFSRFSQIVDLLGGVSIELTNAEAAHLNAHYGYWLSAGVNHLNGEQALSYSRIRAIGDDFGRTSRQRTVLNALIQSYKNRSVTEMLDIMEGILPLLTTDMSNKEMVGYVTELFPLLASSSISTQRIPIDGGYYPAYVRGMAVLVPDLDVNNAYLESVVMGKSE